MGPALAHVSGYVGLPNLKDLTNREIKSYQLVGKGGLEIQYDSYLRGTDGFRYQKEIQKEILKKRESLSMQKWKSFSINH